MSVGTSPIDTLIADQGIVTADQAKMLADQATLTTDDATAYAAVNAAGGSCIHLVFSADTPPAVIAAYYCTSTPPGTVTLTSVPLI